MIEIDRNSGESVHVQVMNAMRFQIANGQFRIGDKLPATRKLASQLGISFHTVRKAYMDLAQEGLIKSFPGSGYSVIDAEPLDKSERMERGASIMASALKQVVGLGLDDQEIEHLFSEQLDLLDTAEEAMKIVVVAPYKELGQACAIQISVKFQRECHSCTMDELSRHSDADILIVPFKSVKQILSLNTRADVVGVVFDIDEIALGSIARMLDHETLGLVTRYSGAIAPLLADLRVITRFSGQVVAVSMEEGNTYVASLIRQSDLLVYTEGAERAVRPFLQRAKRHVRLSLSLASSSIERLRGLVP